MLEGMEGSEIVYNRIGEKLSSILLSYTLTLEGIENKVFTGREAGIVTDYCFGRAYPLHEISRKLVRESLLPIVKSGLIPIVTGFIAGTIDGKVTTLGRGGSDYRRHRLYGPAR